MYNPPHQGGVVRRWCLDPLGLSVTRAAQGLGITRQALSDLVNEKAAISVEMAFRLSKAFGSSPDWVMSFASHLLRGCGPSGEPLKRGVNATLLRRPSVSLSRPRLTIPPSSAATSPCSR